MSALFEKSAAYTNVVVFAGYAAFFAIWGYTKDHLTPRTELGAALLMIVSAGTFVLFEVVKMMLTAWLLRGPIQAISDQTLSQNPEALRERFQALTRAAERVSIRFHRFWLVQLVITVLSGVAALIILLFGVTSKLLAAYHEYVP